MLTPGAKTSISEPKFENEALASAIVEAATRITLGTRPGELLASPADPPEAAYESLVQVH
jgi:hypothetical protein